jgi:hypothetical protein
MSCSPLSVASDGYIGCPQSQPLAIASSGYLCFVLTVLLGDGGSSGKRLEQGWLYAALAVVLAIDDELVP